MNEKLPDGRKAYNDSPEFTGPPRPFGFYINEQKAKLRNALIAEGKPHDHLAVEAAYIAANANKESYAEYQRRVLYPRWAAAAKVRFDRGGTERQIGFNKLELEWLADHFEGANDPMAIQIAAKIAGILK